MQTYTVYEPRPAPENIGERAASLVFVKEGFSFLAFLAPLIWLLVNRLWVVSAAYVGVVAVLFGLASASGGSQEIIPWMFPVINLILGFEARDILRHSLEADGYVLRAIVSGRNLEECEQRYLHEWLPDARLDQARLASGSGMTPGGDVKRSHKEPVIGMFPAHGG